jgi:hypothetical protein
MSANYYRSFITRKLGSRRFYFEGEGGGSGEGGTNNDGNGSKVTTFTQDQVNAILNKEKTKWQQTNKTTVSQLEELKKQDGLSKEKVAELENQIAQLQTTYMTESELLKRDTEKKTTELSTQLEQTSGQLKFWNNKYTQLLVSHAITSAAATNDAYNPEQMLTQLGGAAKVVPVIQDGKETGEFEVKIQFTDKDKDGKPVVLELTPDATMKRMKELPQQFGNLFKAGVNGGLGGNNAGLGAAAPQMDKVLKDPGEYRKNRDKILKGEIK